MSEDNEILRVLADAGIEVVGSPIRSHVNQRQLTIFVSITRNDENKQHPSNRMLNQFREQFATGGDQVDFLLVDSNLQDIEAGLRATLLHAFATDVRNVFLTVNGEATYVWIDPKIVVDPLRLAEIEDKTKLYLSGFNLQLAALRTTREDNLPGKLVCLNAIRLLAPINLIALKQSLVYRGFAIPSDDWLSRRLDALRKNEMIMRLADGTYVLSMRALRNLGTAKYGRASPDVSRMLALARHHR